MNLPTKIAYNNAWITIILAICAALSAIATALDDLEGILDSLSEDKLSFFLPVVLILLFIIAYTLVVGVVALIIHRENRRLRNVFKYFCEINLIYRDNLISAFYGDDPGNIEDRKKKLASIETATLASVCQRISKIFNKLTGRDCMITFKVLTKEDGKSYATTCSRSEDHSERDNTEPRRFKVNVGCNTAFDHALRPDTTGRIPHFHSADMLKLRDHGEYQSERPRWERYYKSAIVVPVNCFGSREKPERNDIGLLCVDTKSRNRLNDSYHVEIMAALAYQMYNFISFMRGIYTVSTEKERNSSNE